MARAFLRALVGACRISLALAPIYLLVAAPGVSAAEEPTITAQYAVVVDADTGQVLFDKAMDTPTPPASLTKIFTAAVALETASLDEQLTVDQYDIVGEAAMGLQPGEEVSLRTAIYGMMLPSGNDAAMTVARNLGALPGNSPQQSIDRFMERVNATTTRLGLRGTKLLNPHGLDQPGHQSTARDIAAMTMYALKNEEFRKAFGAPYYQAEGHELYQVNRLLSTYQGLIGGKTGITDGAGYCLVEVAQRNGHTVIAVLLKSTSTAWYADAETLLDYGFDALAAGAPASSGLPKITLAPADPATRPAVNAPAQVDASDLLVNHLNDQVAVVQHSALSADGRSFSWRWPVASLASMATMLALVMNYPALLGLGSLLLRNRPAMPRASLSLAFAGGPSPRMRSTGRRSSQSRRRRQPAPRRNRGSSRTTRIAPAAIKFSGVRHSVASDWSAQQGFAPQSEPPTNSAMTCTSRAIRLANRGDYHAAMNEFARALQLDAAFDLTRCEGFWGMQPAGHVAAAKAYLQIDRPADARSLLTVVKLSCGSHRDLERLLEQVAGFVRA